MIGCEDSTPKKSDCLPCDDLCTPAQPLPPSFTNFTIPPNNVLIFHTCDGGVLDHCMKTGTENFTSWATWVENNVIKSWCELKQNPCHLNYSAVDTDGKVVVKAAPIGKIIADCLGMSVTKPHIIYDATSKTAIAGKITLDTIPCTTFNKLLRDCPPIADAGLVPARVLGHDGTTTRDPKYYKIEPTQPLKLSVQQQQALSNNRYLGVAADTRLFIRDSVVQYRISENEAWDSTTSQLTIGKAGLFQIDISVMCNVFYKTPLAGWIIAMMMGFKVTPVVNNSPYEVRVDERVLYLDYNNSAFDGQDVILNGSLAIPLEAGDVILPRVWFNNTFIPSGSIDRRLDIWLNKSATTQFSIYRIPTNEIKLGA
jgi:hypothetical protein